MPKDKALIRHGTPDDLAELTALYNYYVEHTAITFDVASISEEERRSWLAQFKREGPYQLFVAESAGTIIGYASSVRFRAKRAYETSVETSIYLT